MLPRAAFRALRTRPAALPAPHTAPLTAPLARSRQWPRAYAKVGRPKSTQPELTDTSSEPAANTAPSSSTRPRPASANATANKAAAQAQGTEEELAGPQSPARNTEATTAPPPQEPQQPQQPQQPLPDLRFGIPSTFAAEHAAAEGRTKGAPSDPNDPSAAADGEPEHPSYGGAGGRELPKSAYETSTDRRRNRVANWGYLATLLF